MRKILITGANGFIGSSLTEYLLNQNYSVRVMVRRPPSVLLNVDYRIGDFTDNEFLKVSLEDIDCVIHLAGRAHFVVHNNSDQVSLFRSANRDLTLELARNSVLAGVSRFIYMSSIGVNGAESGNTPFDETSVPAPHAPYAVSKYEAEQCLRDCFHDSSVEYVIIRPPLVYGQGAPGNFRRLLKLVSLGAPLPLGGTANKRSLVSLENLISFVYQCVESPDATNQIFLVSDGVDVSTADMVRALARGMGKRPMLFSLPQSAVKYFSRLLRQEALYKQLYGSLSINAAKAHSLAGWHPNVDTKGSLEKVGRLYRRSRLDGKK
jgi:nucleoside-diphosphate-sugar epimerase